MAYLVRQSVMLNGCEGLMRKGIHQSLLLLLERSVAFSVRVCPHMLAKL